MTTRSSLQILHRRHRCLLFALVFCQQLLDGLHLVFEPLLLVYAAANADIALDPYDAVGVQHAVALAYYKHYLFPGAFCNSDGQC